MKSEKKKQLIHLIQQTTDEVFAKVLDAGAGIFLNNSALNLETGSRSRTELKSAGHELQRRGVKLDPGLKASLEFVLGRVADNLSQSRQHYEQSLALWQQSSNLQRQGCLLYLGNGKLHINHGDERLDGDECGQADCG